MRVWTCVNLPAASFSRAGPRLIYSPSFTAPVILQVLTDIWGTILNWLVFLVICCFYFLKSVHTTCFQMTQYVTRGRMSSMLGGVPVIQVFTCGFLNIGGRQGKGNSSSQQDIYQSTGRSRSSHSNITPQSPKGYLCLTHA